MIFYALKYKIAESQGEGDPDDNLRDIYPYGVAYMTLNPKGQHRNIRIIFNGDNDTVFTVQYLIVKDGDEVSSDEMSLNSSDFHIDGTQGESGVLIIGRIGSMGTGEYIVGIQNLPNPSIDVNAPDVKSWVGNTLTYECTFTNTTITDAIVNDVQVTGANDAWFTRNITPLPLTVPGNSSATFRLEMSVPNNPALGGFPTPIDYNDFAVNATLDVGNPAGDPFTAYIYSQEITLLDVLVRDADTHAPLSNALVVLSDDPTVYQTGGDGIAHDILTTPGAKSVFGYKENYLPEAVDVVLSEGDQSATVDLPPGEVLEVQEVETDPLTLQEIIDAGVDPGDAANYHAYHFTVTLGVLPVNFDSPPVHIGDPLVPYPGSPIPFSGGGGGGIIYPIYIPDPDPGAPPGPPPGLILLIIEGEINVLKEFFSVSTVVVNNAALGTPFEIADVLATLSSAGLDSGGLTLPELFGLPQDNPQLLGTVLPGEEHSVEWIVRGDVEGIYTVEVTATGTLQPFGAPLNHMNSGTVEVYGPPELGVEFNVPAFVEAGDPFLFNMQVQNQSPIPANLVSVSLTNLVNCHLNDVAVKPLSPPNLDPFGEGTDTGTVSFQIVSDITGWVLPEWSSATGDPQMTTSLNIGSSGDALSYRSRGPVDMILTDPDGRTLDKNGGSGDIPCAFYSQAHWDGSLSPPNAQLFVPAPVQPGTYTLDVFPQAGAVPGDTYTLERWNTTTESWELIFSQAVPDPGPDTDSFEQGGLPQVGVKFIPATWYTDWLPPNPDVGSIQCYLGNLPPTYTVSDIDTSTIKLNNAVISILFSTVIPGGLPGFSTDPVLLIVFPRQAATASLGVTVAGIYSASITGQFTDLTDFEGRVDVELATLIPAPARPLPESFSLGQNYPNSFNPDTWIPYALPKDSDVFIRIYTVRGTVVREWNLGHQEAGYYDTKEKSAYWDGRNNVGEKLASGIYFYVLHAGDFTATRKMVLHK